MIRSQIPLVALGALSHMLMVNAPAFAAPGTSFDGQKPSGGYRFSAMEKSLLCTAGGFIAGGLAGYFMAPKGADSVEKKAWIGLNGVGGAALGAGVCYFIYKDEANHVYDLYNQAIAELDKSRGGDPRAERLPTGIGVVSKSHGVQTGEPIDASRLPGGLAIRKCDEVKSFSLTQTGGENDPDAGTPKAQIVPYNETYYLRLSLVMDTEGCLRARDGVAPLAKRYPGLKVLFDDMVRDAIRKQKGESEDN